MVEDTGDAQGALTLLKVGGLLKSTPRRGWTSYLDRSATPTRLRRRVESVAEHSYRVALGCMLAPRDGSVDVDRAVRMALIHDLAEAIVGDVTPVDGVTQEDKSSSERAVLEELERRCGVDGLVDLWTEYEARATAEARLVKDMDVLDMSLQSMEYEKGGAVRSNELQDFRSGKLREPRRREWLTRAREWFLGAEPPEDTTEDEDEGSLILPFGPYQGISVKKALQEAVQETFPAFPKNRQIRPVTPTRSRPPTSNKSTAPAIQTVEETSLADPSPKQPSSSLGLDQDIFRVLTSSGQEKSQDAGLLFTMGLAILLVLILLVALYGEK